MSTEIIVRHCAPTLAGLKVGNLFSQRYSDVNVLLQEVEDRNRLLNSKGVYFVLVRLNRGVALVYVYRKKQLQQILAERRVQKFLSQFGYTGFSIEACFEVLKERLLEDDFPHEIGVFLGYPLEDIKAFIQNKGANCKSIGCWKVYTNVNEAEKKFALFKKCTRIYCQRCVEGFDLTRLTVASA